MKNGLFCFNKFLLKIKMTKVAIWDKTPKADIVIIMRDTKRNKELHNI